MLTNSGPYHDEVFKKITADLNAKPLSKEEKLNLIGYSGGGQIAINVSKALKGTAYVDNVVLIGAPVMEPKQYNIGKILDIWSKKDPLSRNITTWKNVTRQEIKGSKHTQYFEAEFIEYVADGIAEFIK